MKTYGVYWRDAISVQMTLMAPPELAGTYYRHFFRASLPENSAGINKKKSACKNFTGALFFIDSA